MSLNLLQAQKCIAKAYQTALNLKIKVSICIVDSAGHLLAFERMDGATIGTIDIAIKKAKTAAYFQKNTEILGQLSQPEGPLYNIEHSNGGLITFAGGVPIQDQKQQIIGAIGISGSTVNNDLLVAQSAAQNLWD